MESRALEAMADERDRISTLPDFLIHQILSYLSSDEEAARTCVLSKTWLQLYSTSPNLTVDQSFYSTLNEIKKQQPLFLNFSFFNSVHNTLLRYQSLNLTIHKLRIILSYLDVFTSPRLDKSLRLAVDIGVQDLFISLGERHGVTPLPSSMFEYPNVLTSLTVKNFRFPKNLISNTIMFPFLKTLCLHKVLIDNEMIQKLISHSPSLEKVVLFRICGFTRFRVSGLGELKIIDIDLGLLDKYQDDIKKIEIDIEDAPSLSSLRYSSLFNLNFPFEAPFLLRVGSAPNLKVLELQKVNISDNQLKEFMIKFPLLENLKLVECDQLERITIASSSLKHLCLSLCMRLVETEIDAPSLLELEYCGDYMLQLSLNNTPDEVMSRICITHSYPGQDTDEWYHRLRKLLKCLTRATVLFMCEQDIEFTLDSRSNPLPPEHQIENFMPEMNPSYSLFAGFMKTLFSSSRPITIVIKCGFVDDDCVDFRKLLSSELLGAMKNLNCCSSDDRIKCWRHYLEDIKVEVCEDSLGVWQPLDLEALQFESTCQNKELRFSLKWYTNLNV